MRDASSGVLKRIDTPTSIFDAVQSASAWEAAKRMSICTASKGHLISHIVQPSDISLPFKGRAGVGMGNFGVLVVSVRSDSPLQLPP